VPEQFAYIKKGFSEIIREEDLKSRLEESLKTGGVLLDELRRSGRLPVGVVMDQNPHHVLGPQFILVREFPVVPGGIDEQNLVAAGGDRDRLVHLHEVASGREYAGLPGDRGGAHVLAYSPAGKLQAVADRKIAFPQINVWDTARCRLAFTLRGHARGINGLSFSPTGETLASASDDQFVKLWDVGSGKLLRDLRQNGCVSGLGFGPGGQTLIAAINGFGTNLSRSDLRRMPELKKRPAPVKFDLDRATGPVVPELQLAGQNPHGSRGRSVGR